MAIRIATKTLEAIDSVMLSDQGASFRYWLGRVIGHMGDAYDSRPSKARGHLGASMIGRECERSLWYGFHWVKQPSFDGRMIRLFNRGHLEEARFIAMLLMIGCTVYQQDEHGKQFRISEASGHFGGSCDGICVGCPDLPSDKACLTEFKTHNESSFSKLKQKGVKAAKHEHYVQMCVYMSKLGLDTALYMAVNKNTDEVYAELVALDPAIAAEYIERGKKIVWMKHIPERVSESPGYFGCRYCEYQKLCHFGDDVERSCRTCRYGYPHESGKWVCNASGELMDVEGQRVGCEGYKVNEEL